MTGVKDGDVIEDLGAFKKINHQTEGIDI